MNLKHSKGIYLALATALISGISIFVNKFAVDAISPPLVFTAVKNSGVGLIILSFILLTGKWQLVKTLKKRQYIWLITIGIIGGSIPFYLFFTGLSTIPAINAAMIHKSLVLWVAVLASIFLKEKITKLHILAILVLFSSNYLVGGFKGFTFSTGELYILLATLFWSVETIVAKKILSEVDPDILTGFRMGFGSLVLLAAACITTPQSLSGALHLSLSQWMWMSITMFALLAYVSIWYRALQVAPAILVTTILVASTVVTNVLSAVFVTHAWNTMLTTQSLAMSMGMVLLWFASTSSVQYSSRST